MAFPRLLSPNAPLTGTGHPYEYDPPREKRRPGDAIREAGEGDDAWHRGNMDVALTSYLNAWQADPQPELALKIGELYFQKDMGGEARAAPTITLMRGFTPGSGTLWPRS